MFWKTLGLATALLASCAAPQSGASDWIPLFNGQDLDGWSPKITGYEAGENFDNTFRVEEGLLKVRYDNYGEFKGRFGHLFFEAPFSHYKLRTEYRFVGDQCPGGPGWARRNSGVMVHGQSVQSMGLHQEFPVSIEVQTLGGDGEHDRSTGNLCTPGTHVVMDDKLLKRHCTNSSSKTVHGPEWVMLEIEVRGNESIKHFIDGELVLEYTGPQLDTNDPDAKRLIAAGQTVQLSGGTISLQSESHPIDYRSVEL
ncbi:MAG: DUF1080 domain-containing protein, partial [Planctomycetota bacterium]|nr:DUF1080 domain-containing protein [Planctomycetota bacterium]